MQGIFDGLPVDHQASVYWNNEREAFVMVICYIIEDL